MLVVSKSFFIMYFFYLTRGLTPSNANSVGEGLVVPSTEGYASEIKLAEKETAAQLSFDESAKMVHVDGFDDHFDKPDEVFFRRLTIFELFDIV